MYKKFIMMTLVTLLCVGTILAIICILYEKYYIHSSANKRLEESVLHLHDKDPIFGINYYFVRIEFTNSTSLGRRGVLENEDEEKYLVLKKDGLYFEKSNKFYGKPTSLCLVIEDNVNIRDLHNAYILIKKKFNFSYLVCATPSMQRDKETQFKSFVKFE